ncbi:hypothetical protein ASNO1_44720 [Corallococcus caeni]|uniref:Uncharacterized protein n=1 Tax=Corallococcus caeni TaxID=3082388 RepID=A0ABQ6QX47_9BACT|nr:hypothetical protein ASNO1_44720 [Corallococcus sp. NO1]
MWSGQWETASTNANGPSRSSTTCRRPVAGRGAFASASSACHHSSCVRVRGEPSAPFTQCMSTSGWNADRRSRLEPVSEAWKYACTASSGLECSRETGPGEGRGAVRTQAASSATVTNGSVFDMPGTVRVPPRERQLIVAP